MFHEEAPRGDVHGVHYWTYATIADRDAHVPSDGPTRALNVDDVTNRRWCWVESEQAFYVLLNHSPISWGQIIGASPVIPHHASHESGGSDEVPHGNLSGAGTNTHAQIDTHLGSTSNPHAVTAFQVGADVAGSAAVVQGNLNSHASDTGNPHAVTAAQVSADPVGAAAVVQGNLNTHIGNTLNPHSVTKAQVALGNVTDDAQLKRAANDFIAFAVKAAPVGADKVLIEDSAAAGVKKYAALSSLPGAVLGTKERFFFVEPSANLNNMRVRSIGATGSFRFTFMVPNDFNTLVSLDAVGVPNGTFAGQSIELTSNYGAVGELVTQHAEAYLIGLYSGTLDTVMALNLATVFTALAAGDYCGVFIDHKAIGVTINYFGVRLRYT